MLLSFAYLAFSAVLRLLVRDRCSEFANEGSSCCAADREGFVESLRRAC
jgi:hypothetical protein